MLTHLRFASLIGLLASLLVLPMDARSAAPLLSAIQFSRHHLAPGSSETVMVEARDLNGSPLIAARGHLVAQLGSHKIHRALPLTDSHGRTSVSFTVPHGTHPGPATVSVTLSRGSLNLSLQSAFLVSSASHRAISAAALTVVARAVPAVVTSPDPEWIVVSVRSRNGAPAAGIPVNIAAVYAGGTVSAGGTTDTDGIATLRLDTTSLPSTAPVQVGIVVHRGTTVASAAAQFSVESALPTPTAAPIATATTTPIPPATATYVPTVSAPAPLTTTVPAYATATGAPVSAPPTATPTPIATPTFASLSGSDPTVTSASTGTATPAQTPASTGTPTPTATPAPQCPGSLDGCRQALLHILNADRVQANTKYGLQLQPYTLDLGQSDGGGGCVGSQGHSQAMANSGHIWHQDPSNPNSPASFPNDICGRTSTAGENVGEWPGDELTALQDIDAAMISEQFVPGCEGDHACNILSGSFTQVGIGIVQSGGQWYVTEDFTG